ncbi:response regulator transcription factor [Gottfriedia acidiceleris]|uniref:response regulator transcription factor n=1 Tax=Gottfriedia acidiceleris TaxID=371036 RepID=UPI0033931D8B
MYRLLLLEDEHEIGSTLETVLKHEGYEVDWFVTGDEAVDSALNKDYDLLILDVMLKKTGDAFVSHVTSGLDVARIVNQNKKSPYLLLTSRSEPFDIMQGLDMGAEDYITKPYSLTVLLARIRSILRRVVQENNDATTSGIIKAGNIEANMLTHKVTVDDKPIHLANQLFDLLCYFIQRKNQIIPKEELYQEIWGYDPNELHETNNLEVNIRRLREKIGGNVIKNVRGRGYVLEIKDI